MIWHVGRVGELLERAARAVPAVIEDRTTGWLFRHTDNRAWWSGAVLAHGPADAVEKRVEAAEKFYADHGAVPRFQVCPDCPDSLDQVLAERGYRWHSPILLMTAPADISPPRQALPGAAARLDESLVPNWLAAVSAIAEPQLDVEDETRLLGGVDLPSAFVSVFSVSDPVGVGRAVIDGSWAGIFNMTTKPDVRSRGVGRLVLSSLAHWANSHGASQLYLQVDEENAAARRLYDGAGFSRLSEYHYRVRDGVDA